jgi:hypothetical protein
MSSGAKLRRTAERDTPTDLKQAGQVFATTDAIAERVRKIGGVALRSIGHVGRLQRVLDNEAEYVTPLDMLVELHDDNKQLTAHMRETHGLWDEREDVATASLLEVWIDEAERRTWFCLRRRAERSSPADATTTTLTQNSFENPGHVGLPHVEAADAILASRSRTKGVVRCRKR